MKKINKQIWKNPFTTQFSLALLTISNQNDLHNFLGDVMTEKEITEISARLEAARMLKNGAKYTNIVIKTKLSSRTIARISEWMKNGYGGYAKVLYQLEEVHNHI
jgi:TrpR-related protein YerC/YecD